MHREASGNRAEYVSGAGHRATVYGAFITVLVLTWLYVVYLLLLQAEKKRIKPLCVTSSAVVLHIPAFCFLSGCVTRNFCLGASHEARSTDFGLAGLIWTASLCFMAISIKTLICQPKDKDNGLMRCIQEQI